MESPMVKAIIIAIAVALTAVLVVWGVSQFNKSMDTANEGAKKLTEATASLEESDLTLYDSQSVLGSDVISCIRKFENDEIAVVVCTKKMGTTPVYYGWGLNGSNELVPLAGSGLKKGTLNKAQSVTDDYYINSTATFVGSLLRDVNNRITGIKWEQQ